MRTHCYWLMDTLMSDAKFRQLNQNTGTYCSFDFKVQNTQIRTVIVFCINWQNNRGVHVVLVSLLADQLSGQFLIFWKRLDKKFKRVNKKDLRLDKFFFGRPKKMRNRPDNWSTKRLTKTTWTGLLSIAPDCMRNLSKIRNRLLNIYKIVVAKLHEILACVLRHAVQCKSNKKDSLSKFTFPCS